MLTVHHIVWQWLPYPLFLTFAVSFNVCITFVRFMMNLHLSHIKHTKCQNKVVAIGQIQAGVPAQTKMLKQKSAR